ncbi:hypothetical protein [Variovorax defluvii]
MMTEQAQPASHEWWRDRSDPTEQRAFLASYRAAQRAERGLAWRRNVMLGVLAVAVPFLVRLISTL